MSETDEIKARLPIEQLVGSYVPLKKAGRIYKACCPFHNEKTPSFTVSPDRGIYKCFGCGEGGDIFDFVMKLEGLTFPETLQLLAERTGVQLEPRHAEAAKAAGTSAASKPRLYELNAYAAKLWHTILIKHPRGEQALGYLKGRGLTDKTIADFELGYAPLGTTTSAALQKQGFKPAEISLAGDPGKFQDRVTFPICDITGKVVGFTGRLLEMTDDPRVNRGPKYWNTPETPVFIKSRALYALHLAKRAIQDEDLAILAEGQMDVLMLHQYGFTHTVASSGTALTTEQIQLLGRFTTNIAFAYDGDKAGIQATKRGLELVMAAELNPFVIPLPNGKDPADCLLNDPDGWQEAYEGRQHGMEWLIAQAMREHPELTPISKKEIVQEILPWLSRIKNEVEQAEWLRWLAVRLETDEKNLRTALSRIGGKPGVAIATTTPKPEDHKVNLTELAIALVLAFPSIFPTVREQVLSLPVTEATPFLDEIFPVLREAESDLAATLKERLGEQKVKETSLYIQGILQKYDETETNDLWAMEEFLLLAQRLRSDAKEDTKASLAQQISLAQQQGDSQKVQELFARLKEMI
ncbi:MAG: DNA primase [bacterium]